MRGPTIAENPVKSIFKGTFLCVVFGLVSLVVFLCDYRSVGVLEYSSLSRSAYVFDTLEISGTHIRMSVHGAVLFPTVQKGQVNGAVVLGQGTYSVVVKDPSMSGPEDYRYQLQDAFAAAFMSASYQSIERLNEKFNGRPAEPAALGQLPAAAQFLDSLREWPHKTAWLGLPRSFYAREGAFVFDIRSMEYGKTTCVERTDGSTLIHFQNGQTILIADGAEIALAPRQLNSARLLATLWVFGTLTFFLIYATHLLTLGISPEKMRHRMGRVSSPVESAAPAAAVLVCAGAGALGASMNWPAWLRTFPYMAMLALIVILLGRERHFVGSYLGMSSTNLTSSVLAAVILGFFALFAGALQFPGAFEPMPALRIVQTFVWSTVTVGFFREAFYRGYLQTTIQDRWGPLAGLALPAMAAGFIHLCGQLALGERCLNDILIEAGLAVPALSLFLGYFFQRTRNLWGNSLLHGLIDFLPKVLRF